ncbi:TPA: hypothetical protein ACKLRZ_002218, partial [Neisseria gonorrhoeae]
MEVIGNVSEVETGTTIKFHPDYTIMEKENFDFDTIIDHSKQIAYLNKGLKITVENVEKNII